MQNDRSGARRHQRKHDEVLSPVESARRQRGQYLKRYVRAAAALNKEIYDDTALADAVDIGRGAVLGWWNGAQIEPDNLRRLARAIGVAPDQLTDFVYGGGSVPILDPGLMSVLEGVREARALLAGEAPDTPSSQPEPQPRGSEAGRE